MNDHRQMSGMLPDRQAAIALKHLLTRMRDDARLYHLMGEGTQTFDLVTEAYAALIGTDLAALRHLLVQGGPERVIAPAPTLLDDEFTDPAIAACHLTLWDRQDGAMTNAVQLLVRPADLRGDESGAHPGERFVMVTILREEIEAMLHELQADLADCLKAAGAPRAGGLHS